MPAMVSGSVTGKALRWEGEVPQESRRGNAEQGIGSYLPERFISCMLLPDAYDLRREDGRLDARPGLPQGRPRLPGDDPGPRRLPLLAVPRTNPAIDAIRAFRFKDARVDLAERRAALENYGTDVERSTTEATTPSAEKALPMSDQDQAKMVATAAVFFKLAASTLPLIPKAERQRFIAESMKALPVEADRFRRALVKLADRAPEVSPEHAGDVIITSGTMRFGGDADIPPAPRV